MSRYDLLIVGGGTAGLTAAIGAAGVGARVLLAEEHRTGGDCLWTGCVPSKTLIAAAQRVHDARTADRVGLTAVDMPVDFAKVMGRVHEAISTIEPHDSPQRLRGLGVEVVEARATFTGPGTADVGGRTVRWRTALIATGASPSVPPIPGIDDVDVLTSDSIWSLTELPERLAIIGGGAVGVELGQAFSRLGSQVTILEQADRLVPAAPAPAAAVLANVFADEGIDVRTAARVSAVRPNELDVVDAAGITSTVGFDRLLVATGRRARTSSLGLDHIGVDTDASGHIIVDETLRTTGRNVFAAGDVTGLLPFTHVAGTHGGLVVTNALFKLRRSFDATQTPWAVFTDPEIAVVGLGAAEARARWGDDAIISRHDHTELDRAITTARTVGFAELVADPKRRLVGATIVGEAAGESIAAAQAWLGSGATLRQIAAMVPVYPTMTEGPWRAALEPLRERYLSPRTRRLAAVPLWLLRLFDRPGRDRS